MYTQQKQTTCTHECNTFQQKKKEKDPQENLSLTKQKKNLSLTCTKTNKLQAHV